MLGRAETKETKEENIESLIISVKSGIKEKSLTVAKLIKYIRDNNGTCRSRVNKEDLLDIAYNTILSNGNRIQTPKINNMNTLTHDQKIVDFTKYNTIKLDQMYFHCPRN